jgi:hypothetical protein
MARVNVAGDSGPALARLIACTALLIDCSL